MQKDISAFFTVKNPKPKKQTKKYDNNFISNINVYTDGACINNGKKNAKAGWGVYFNENSELNACGIIEGKQTNQVAELTATIKAYEILSDEIEKERPITIYSDSIYAIRCCTTYGEKCEKSCWIKKKPIPNVGLVKKAYYLYKDKPSINFVHIKAHTGKQDEHSLGNEGADKLANKAIGITSCPYTKIYLNVPFNDKNDAKKLGAKWEYKKKNGLYLIIINIRYKWLKGGEINYIKNLIISSHHILKV